MTCNAQGRSGPFSVLSGCLSGCLRGLCLALLSALFWAGLACCPPAEAADNDVPPVIMAVTIYNKSGHDAQVCLNYMNYPGTVWVTQGWWTIKARDQLSFSIPSSNGVAYFYARDNKGGPAWWGGKPGERDSIRRAVVQEDFLVPDGRKLKGTKHRIVTLQRIRAQGRGFIINLSDS